MIRGAYAWSLLHATDLKCSEIVTVPAGHLDLRKEPSRVMAAGLSLLLVPLDSCLLAAPGNLVCLVKRTCHENLCLQAPGPALSFKLC